jgi:hypothetical protein
MAQRLEFKISCYKIPFISWGFGSGAEEKWVLVP